MHDAVGPILEPVTQQFVDALAAAHAAPVHALPAAQARAALQAVQSVPVGKPAARIEDTILPIGPRGAVPVRIVRPVHAAAPLPAVMYFHGGGWMMGGADTHDRLIREIAVGAHAAVVFVDYSRSPEACFPVALEEAYAATCHVAANALALGLDRARLAVAGDDAGGNLAAAVSLLCKQRRGPRIALQLLFYPLMDAALESASCLAFANGPWLTRAAMAGLWNLYLPDRHGPVPITAAPLRAAAEHLVGLPEALVITAENDMLRDEGEAYARKLAAAGVRVTCTRYIGTIHDFVMFDALADTPAARAAIAQASAALGAALE